MADIASRSCYATIGLLCDIHHIDRSMLHQIGEDHRIVGYAQEASTSNGPSIRPPVSFTPVHMQPIRGRGRGRVDRRGRGRDGGRGHGPYSKSGSGTLQPTLPTSIPPPNLPSHLKCLYPHTLTHHLPYSHTLTHHLPYPHTLTHLYLSPKPASIAVDITFSSHLLLSPTLPRISDTILDLVFELGSLPTK